MTILDEIQVGGKKIQLCFGDLAKIPLEHKVDLLIVSAFPGNYTPTSSSLIGALFKQNVSVQTLAVNKEVDLREELGCWISRELSQDIQNHLHFKRILCFEPALRSNHPPEVVGDIFRCLNAFVLAMNVTKVAMPLVACGNQRISIQSMLRPLLGEAIFWMKSKLPLQELKIVERDSDKLKELQEIFSTFKAAQSSAPLPPSQPDPSIVDETPIPPKITGDATGNTYDLFISYSHQHKSIIENFVTQLKTLNNNINIFFDKDSIQKGGQWLRIISDSIDKSQKVLMFISPEYTKSKICWDEFQCAKIREYDSEKEILLSIYLFSCDSLPSIMKLNNWIDCREGDTDKINVACQDIIKSIA